LGAKLYAGLFGSLPAAVLAKDRWTIAADGPLFDLPFAALPEGGRYLIERHSVRLVNGLAAASPSAAPAGNGAFVGIADPVYNRADPRNTTPAAKASVGAAPLELPRLLGSGREIESCATVWRGERHPVELAEGPSATRTQLARLAAAGPTVLHVAAHMLFPKDVVGRGMLALSLQDDRTVELVGETDIAGMTAHVGLVVLNGCSSGRGVALPGAGLMGMTRAWLAAGANSVVATRWPAPDQQSGALFPELYHLYLHDRPAHAGWSDLLRNAQLAELRAGGSRAQPAAWASYFCVERN
jgi:CHAT domain-containing protein